VALRSHVYTDVDGAVRCLEVFHRQELFFHANNHLLYPVDVFAWHRLLSLFGVKATSPFEYLALTQIMNAVAAAGCAAVLYRLALLAMGSPGAGLMAAVMWRFPAPFCGTPPTPQSHGRPALELPRPAAPRTALS